MAIYISRLPRIPASQQSGFAGLGDVTEVGRFSRDGMRRLSDYADEQTEVFCYRGQFTFEGFW